MALADTDTRAYTEPHHSVTASERRRVSRSVIRPVVLCRYAQIAASCSSRRLVISHYFALSECNSHCWTSFAIMVLCINVEFLVCER